MAFWLVEAPPPPPPPPERVLWTLQRGDLSAVARELMWPHGSELRIEIGGQLRYSKLFRSVDRDAHCQRKADEKRQQLRSVGFTSAD